MARAVGKRGVARRPLSFVSPCLARLTASPPEGPEWVHEIKYDGYRLQALIENGSARMFTRSGLDWTGRFGKVELEFASLGDWLKCKCVRADPFVVVGYVPSAAGSDMVGSLALAYRHHGRLIYAGRVGTGFTARVAAALKELLEPAAAPAFAALLTREQRKGVVWVAPDHVAQVEYRAWTADGILRHASFKDLRRDKTAKSIGQPASLGIEHKLSHG